MERYYFNKTENGYKVYVGEGRACLGYFRGRRVDLTLAVKHYCDKYEVNARRLHSRKLKKDAEQPWWTVVEITHDVAPKHLRVFEAQANGIIYEWPWCGTGTWPDVVGVDNPPNHELAQRVEDVDCQVCLDHLAEKVGFEPGSLKEAILDALNERRNCEVYRPEKVEGGGFYRV